MNEEIEYLKKFMLEGRMERMLSVIQNRTRYISVVIEDIFQSQNISAVLRSCDCFGIQDIHVLQGKNRYQENNDVSLGSSKWVSSHLYEKTVTPTKDLFKQLRDMGYHIVATSPHENNKYLNRISTDKPIAIVMGSEVDGLSKEAIENADETVSIPMYGFSESFNISVATALILKTLRDRIHEEKREWQLSENEKEEILLHWMKISIKDSNNILKVYHSTKN